jgi:hypothetical protein
VSFGQLTKQLAQQAIGNQVKEVVDSLRPQDPAAAGEPGATASKTPLNADSVGAVIVGQIAAMQNALKEDQELVVLCNTGAETLRVLKIYAPSWRVAVLTGTDSQNVVTRVICPFESLQLICKPLPVVPPAKPERILLITPKPKQSEG